MEYIVQTRRVREFSICSQRSQNKGIILNQWNYFFPFSFSCDCLGYFRPPNCFNNSFAPVFPYCWVAVVVFPQVTLSNYLLKCDFTTHVLFSFLTVTWRLGSKYSAMGLWLSIQLQIKMQEIISPYYGNRITVHRNGTLDIRGVRQTDAVQLVCIGRNEGGEARLIVQLVITDHLEKPSFRDPVNERITAIAGHSINLNCSVQGYPEPTTSWILPNGTEVLSGNRLHRFYHKRDGILHISGLSTGDAGTYRCTARNPGGYVERVVFLKVGLRPEISNQYNNLVSIINGETLQLHCITQPNQRAQISWTLPNGMVLDAPQAVGRFSLLENGSLTVREASVFDRGTYLCKVSSDYGTSIMNVPVIVIAYPPRITSEPAPVIYARPGNSVKLNCMAIGIPKAEITWELPDKSHLTTGAQSRLYGNKFLHPQGLEKWYLPYPKCSASGSWTVFVCSPSAQNFTFPLPRCHCLFWRYHSNGMSG
uniref:Matrix remodeling associated 5 n=1 Tax=Pavo cristatus TaxID=9049 RepID=A0A8C9FGE6_PAVCR